MSEEGVSQCLVGSGHGRLTRDEDNIKGSGRLYMSFLFPGLKGLKNLATFVIADHRGAGQFFAHEDRIAGGALGSWSASGHKKRTGTGIAFGENLLNEATSVNSFTSF